MKKIFAIFLFTLFFLFSFKNEVYAQSTCSITAKSGSTSSGSGFTVTARVNTSGLDPTKQYALSENLSGSLGDNVVQVFNLQSNSDQQFTFDVNGGSAGNVVILTVREYPIRSNIQLCSGQVFLTSSTTPNSSNNLPSHPQNGSTTTINGNCGESAIDTAIGCVPINDQNALIGFFLRWGIGIGGGIAFLLILAAGFQIITSRGDPNRLKAGQELMTSAIAGLLLLIFSLVILRIIGFDILKIGAFQ